MSNTIKSVIESFVYPHLEYFTNMVFENDEDTVFHGVRVLDDKEKFTQGALVNAACLLYAYYVKVGDARSDAVLERLHRFITIASANECKTWGKLGILRGFNILYENGLLHKVSESCIELVKDKTDYIDFFDKKTIATPGKATNYMQVAMACAGYREKLGWENDGYADIIKDKLSKIISENSVNGWMDDEIPYGRFDRYSLVLTSEFFDTATDVGLKLPENISANLKDAAYISLFTANTRGDGILFGRSVPCHGDATGAEVIASALAANLIDKKDIPTALAYVMQVVKKLTTTWYDSNEKSFNMWWGGRATNRYRGIGRVLEVNLDLANHLCTTLKNIERAGLENLEIDISTIPSPKKWKTSLITFSQCVDDVKKVLFMRRGNLLISLPFIGHGRNWGKRSAYYAFPVIPEAIEASPVAELPFFIPEYITPDGAKYRPCQYFQSVTEKCAKDCVEVEARGYLSRAETNLPEKSQYRFKIKYLFTGGHVSVTFESDVPSRSVEMITGKISDNVTVVVSGFDSSEPINTENDSDYDGIHRRIFDANLHITKQTKVGYEIDFERCF